MWGKLRALGRSRRREGPGRVRTSIPLVPRLPPGAGQSANKLRLLQMKSSGPIRETESRAFVPRAFVPSPKRISFGREVAFHQWGKLDNSADGEGADRWVVPIIKMDQGHLAG